jgi:phosphopantetheinyl transferase (holo-ACP synthase)
MTRLNPLPFAGTTLRLAGVGVDAERIERFEKFAAGAPPWRYVYSPAEAAHLASLPRAAEAFCAAFCCKEALCKALGERYPFPECECRFSPGALEPQILLAPGFLECRGPAAARVRMHGPQFDGRGECLVEVHLFRPSASAGGAGGERSRLETLSVPDVEAGRAEIEAHFSPAEIVDLGRRRVQSLAGSLALKRALVALWADAGIAAAAVPREFEIAHLPSGAPRLVAAPCGSSGALVSISHTRLWAYGLACLPAAPA